jgi:hypothetical protein
MLVYTCSLYHYVMGTAVCKVEIGDHLARQRAYVHARQHTRVLIEILTRTLGVLVAQEH